MVYSRSLKAFLASMHGVADAGSRLFRSGTHGLNEELGRHRGRKGNKECELCVRVSVMCCGGVQHIIV